MVRIFYSNRSFALLFIPVIIGGFIALNYFFPHHFPHEESHFGMWGGFLPENNWLSQFLAPILILINAIVLNVYFNRNEFLEKNNYLVALLYVTFMSSFHSFYFLDGFAIAQFILGLSLFYFFRLNQNDDARKTVFNVAFLFGVASTFYPLFLLSIPLLYSIIWVMRPFVFRESLLTLVGFVIPLIYAGVYGMYFEIKLEPIDFSSSSSEMIIFDLIFVGSAVVWFLVFSLRTLFKKMQQGSIRIRKLYNILIMLILLSILLTAVEYFAFQKAQTISLILIPLMFIIPYGFGYKKQRSTPTLFYYILLLFSVGKYFYVINF